MDTIENVDSFSRLAWQSAPRTKDERYRFDHPPGPRRDFGTVCARVARCADMARCFATRSKASPTIVNRDSDAGFREPSANRIRALLCFTWLGPIVKRREYPVIQQGWNRSLGFVTGCKAWRCWNPGTPRLAASRTPIEPVLFTFGTPVAKDASPAPGNVVIRRIFDCAARGLPPQPEQTTKTNVMRDMAGPNGLDKPTPSRSPCLLPL